MVEFGYYRAIGVACVVIMMTWAWKAVKWVWLNPRKLEKCLRQQGLNGNSYKFLLGDLKDMSRMRKEAREKPIPFTNDYFYRLHPFEHQLTNKSGIDYFTWMGPIPVVNITEPQLIRDILSRMNDFQRPKLNPLINLLVPGLISSEGEKWAKHRKLVNPAFQLEKLKLMLPAFHTSIVDTINKWEKVVSEKTGSSEIDVFPDFTNLSGDAISRAAFGSSFEEGRRIFELLREQTDLALLLLQSVYIPGWSYVPTKKNKRMKQLDSEIQSLLKGIIQKRQKAMEAGEEAKNDLLGILMESNLKASKGRASNKNGGMSFEEMIDECKLFYFAGQETTSVLLVWTMIMLAKHQDWQQRAREEVLATFGKKKPEFDELNQLKIMAMILYEVLRLYPPVTSFSRKVYNHEKKLGEMSIPPGTMVSLSIVHAHHDPKLWGEDAKEFNPLRFSEGIAKATNGNVSFFPFGWGPRICIGQNFSILEVKMAMAMILQRFSFELSPSYAHAPTRILTLQPQFGACMILRSI